MKSFFVALIMGLTLTLSAQEDECKYTVTDKEDGQEIKTTREYLMHEKVFAGNSQFVFFSLSNTQGVPVLNFQLLAKGKDFPKVQCIDKASRIFIQLANGKIVTLISASEEVCGSLMYDSNEQNNIRVLTGSFLFTKNSFEDLDKSAISFIRVKYATETIDYNIKKELQSESMGQKYYPEQYFINTLKCIQ
ncbi:hypothetical protein GR160_18795 [Flavobacterium sp. Sd200]|uniref:hypothetical protein n=1 Tax=Flavobacterium sp. Sd200 TaxID=2692211 RepID=UPI00136C1064|nr:hypothetical protein [Flavobacterium sp. Sd200]MXN93279.1 hypothetical protein [Flavobacterium sp. Sd200]